jgi:hypothetical protein
MIIKIKPITYFTTIPTKFIKLVRDTFLSNHNLKFLGKGITRQVYKYNKSFVIKFPIDFDGIKCNLIEYLAYKRFKHTKRLAKCHLIWLQGIPCLLMEFLKDTIDDNKVPSWAYKYGDGGQVGYDHKNNIKLYDFGYAYQDSNKKLSTNLRKLLLKSWKSILKHQNFYKFTFFPVISEDLTLKDPNRIPRYA